MVRIANVPIKDLLSLLGQLSSECELVDIVLDTENKKVIINPVDSSIFDIEDLPEEDQELTEDNIYDII